MTFPGPRILIVAGCLAALAGPSTAQDDEQPGTETTVPWQIRLGLRSRAVQQAFPVVDRVVLVPDGATYLRELSRWSPAGRWPVLLEDDHLAPMFIRRFRPAEVIRAEPAGALPPEMRAKQELVERLVISAWGGAPGTDTLHTAFAQRRYIPPGVVIASMNDPAWTAAAALAAGRGQPVAWMDGGLGRLNANLTVPQASRLRQRIDDLLAQQGYSFDKLGDDIDAVTVCRTMPGKADSPFPDSARPDLPPERLGGPIATTDLIGRSAEGDRYAITGWIFGDEAQCAYMAMCSLFLPRRDIRLFNTYPGGEPWASYDPTGAAAALEAQGYDAELLTGAQTNQAAWRRMLAGGLTGDVIVMTSKGNADFFDLNAGRGSPHDVPVLNEPAALYLVHSWSLRSPANRNTVGGRWLERGVYAYVGSVHEPFLSAFVPPLDFAERCVNFAPLLAAARHYPPYPLGQPWKVSTIGDPLMLMDPPRGADRDRIPLPAGYGINLAEHVKTLMRACAESADGAVFAETIATLELLGRDELAARIWELAEQNGCAGPASAAALGPLFRLRQDEAFMRAWRMLPTRDDRALDMLWHLMGPRLSGISDEDTLLQLQASIRRPQAHIDIAAIAPSLARVFGRAHVRDLIERELASTQAEGARKRLQGLLERYASP